jgi:ribonuclease HI
MLRHEFNLLFSIPVTQSIKILGDSDLVLNQIYSVIYAKEKKGLDTVRFDYSQSIYYGMDTIYNFQNFRSGPNTRTVYFTIKKDTISISIHEDDNNNYYEYSIIGIKE